MLCKAIKTSLYRFVPIVHGKSKIDWKCTSGWFMDGHDLDIRHSIDYMVGDFLPDINIIKKYVGEDNKLKPFVHIDPFTRYTSQLVMRVPEHYYHVSFNDTFDRGMKFRGIWWGQSGVLYGVKYLDELSSEHIQSIRVYRE